MQTIKILVVEDNDHDFRRISRAFVKYDFSVTITRAVRAEQALDIINSQTDVHPFDIILTDLMMPGMSGLELAEILSKQDISYPIILLTGEGDERIAVKALKLGVFDYLSKDLDSVFIELLPVAITKAIESYANQYELKKAVEKLQLSSRVFRDTHEGIVITDANRDIIDINPAFSDITGYSREDILGQNPKILSSGKQGAKFFHDMWKSINQHGHWQGEVWNRKKGGELFAEMLNISVLLDDNEDVVNYVGIFSDITSYKQQQDQLSLMAHYDVLTGLPNRSLFADRFKQAAAHSKRTQSILAICFLDLDNFKPINDNFGHDVGDQLLIEVAKRINDTMRDEDTVSRHGGDEFSLLLRDINSYTECKLTIERILAALAEPYLIDDYEHKITASVGITLYPEDNEDIDTLLRHADQAMYQSKLAGKHQHQLFNPQDAQLMALKHHRLSEIKLALENGEFQLYYQPKVNLITGKIFGAEALIRWLHPQKGLIPPLDFLPILEETKLEVELGDWVINQALAQLELWRQQGIKLEVSVNVASHHLLSKTFVSHLNDTLAHYPEVSSQCLQLEILESSALSDLNAISTIIKTCQDALGVNVALDDFGTGYSSLTHLRSLSANTIKIDQSFVRDMLDDPSDCAIIDGIIGLADTFNREVIAEGLETTEHGLMLITMGCKEAQGYGIARPMPADELPNWLARYEPNHVWQQYSHQHRSTKDNKVTFFQLASEQWKNNFAANINTTPEKVAHWPILNVKHCHCGAWIKRIRQEKLVAETGLSQLDKAHEALHHIANTSLDNYQNGNIDTAREELSAFLDAFNSMSEALDHCEWQQMS